MAEREILPKHLKPLHYDLTVEPHLEAAAEFDGSVVIVLEVVEETSRLTLNAVDLDLDISRTQVFTEDGNTVEVTGLEFDEDKEREVIQLKQTLAVGQKIKLKQSFKGSLLNQGAGFFRSPISCPDGTTKWMASTQFEPTDARRVFPCFDEPALKATFTVHLIAAKNLTCLGNMDAASQADLGNGKIAVTFNKTPLISTYFLAFVIGDLQMIETHGFRVPVRLYATVDKNIEHGRYQLELAARTLKVFEKMFQIDYPLPKMDLVAIPGHPGAMENWGLVTFGDTYVLANETDSSAEVFRHAGSTMVHELAHQWFGNLVTMEFWDGLWLNESFADWAELYAWETLDPSWRMWENFVAGGYIEALFLDSNKASHPIEVPVTKATEVDQIFDSISYNKGCAVIRMMANHVGTEVFVKGVQLYLRRAAYGNSTTADLWDALSEVSGQDVGKFMDPWTKHVGYPVIQVLEDSVTNTITLTQNRFLNHGLADPSDDTVLYPVNLRIRTLAGVDENARLYERTSTLKAPTIEFFKLNADQHGFYSVWYTPARLQILGQNARDELLSPEDRIGLISDAFAIAGSGRSKTSDVLSLLELFDEETNYFVWKQIMWRLDSASRAMDSESKRLTDGLIAFRTQLISKTLHRIGWEFKDGEDQVEQMLKALIFGHSGEDAQVQKAAREMFDAFLAGDAKAINVNIQEAVFAIVLEHGGVAEYEAILAAVESTTSIDKRNACLAALGRASQPAFIARTLEFAMSPSILAINEYERVLESLTKHAAGRAALWEWLKAHSEELLLKVGHGLGKYARLVELCTTHLSTREQWEDVKSFFEGKDTEEFYMVLAQSLDVIWVVATWVQRSRDDIEEWLDGKGFLAAT